MNRENYSGTKEEQELIDYLLALRSKKFHPLHIVDLLDLAINYFNRSETQLGQIRDWVSRDICRKQSETDGLKELEKDNLIQKQANIIAKLEAVIKSLQPEAKQAECKEHNNVDCGSDGHAEGS